MEPEDYLLLSGIQHFAFCKRHSASANGRSSIWKGSGRRMSAQSGELSYMKRHTMTL